MTHCFSHIAAVFGRTLLSALLALTLFPALSFAAGGAGGDTMPLSGANDGDDMTMSLQDAPYEEDEILVVFASDTSEREARFSLLSLEDTKEDCVDSALNEASIADVSGEKAVVVPLEEGASVSKAVKEAMNDPAVLYAQPNYLYMPIDALEGEGEEDSATSEDSSPTSENVPPYIPNDPLLSYSAYSWQLSVIHAYEAWNLVQPNQSVTVAVMDSGCNVNHVDLKANVLADYAFNGATEQSGADVVYDSTGHGTHVCGLIGATANNAVGVAGVSNNAAILPMKVFDAAGSCKTSYLIRAYERLFELADSGAIPRPRVVNVSLGSYSQMQSGDLLLIDSIHKALERGILTVCAAGNGDNVFGMTDFSWPSDLEEVISVTALSDDGVTPLAFSDYNENKDIAAPGDYMYSADVTSSASYARKRGTSMAAPMVSGVLALMWAANPNLTAEEAREALLSTTDPISPKEGREGLYGSGCVNAFSAVTAVLDYQVEEYTSEADLVTYASGIKPIIGSFKCGNIPLFWSPDLQCWQGLFPKDADWLDYASFAITADERGDLRKPGCVEEGGPAGDVNNSGSFNIVDVQFAYDLARGRYLLDFASEASLRMWLTADLNGTGNLSASDAQAAHYALHYGWLR